MVAATWLGTTTIWSTRNCWASAARRKVLQFGAVKSAFRAMTCNSSSGDGWVKGLFPKHKTSGHVRTKAVGGRRGERVGIIVEHASSHAGGTHMPREASLEAGP